VNSLCFLRFDVGVVVDVEALADVVLAEISLGSYMIRDDKCLLGNEDGGTIRFYFR